jgi:hypothetical protein
MGSDVTIYAQAGIGPCWRQSTSITAYGLFNAAAMEIDLQRRADCLQLATATQGRHPSLKPLQRLSPLSISAANPHAHPFEAPPAKAV